jgi:hypothetical protein
MMRSRIVIGAVMLTACLAVWALASDQPWFDMKNCEMCKNYTKHPGLMEAMKFEQKKISNGFVGVCFVAEDQMENYRAANSDCKVLGDKMMTGEQVPLCGSCVAMGEMIKEGAKMEQVELQNGGVMMMTSDDAAVVEHLHAWVDRNAEEMAKMMEAKEAATE